MFARLTQRVSKASQNVRRGITLAMDRLEPTEERLRASLCHYDTISFDVFDTLIKRDCLSPHLIFVRAASACNERLSVDTQIDPEEFCKDRMEAGSRLREMAAAGICAQPTIEDIYRLLPDRYSETRDALLEQELSCELQGCFPNPPMKRVFDSCVATGKRVVLVSDMYLPRSTIEQMLAKCGYAGYEKLYVSSEWGATKAEGRLYGVVARDLKARPSEIVHIGDDMRSDLLGAFQAGIKGIHVSRHPKRTVFSGRGRISATHHKAYQQMIAAMNDRIDPQWSAYKKYGFECLGPLLLGFSRWVEDIARRRGIHRLHFLSRDGYLLKEAFDLVSDSCTETSTYTYVSRKSVHVPLLCQYLEASDYLALNGKKRWSLTTACNRLLANPKEHESEWRKLGFGEGHTFQAADIAKDPRLERFLNSLMETARARSEEARESALTYLSQEGLACGSGVVDTGGIGTTQACLQQLLGTRGHPAELTGMYLWSYRGEAEDYNVYLNEVQGTVGGETILSEIFMTSEEGTVSGYNNDGVAAMPILENFEYADHPDDLRAIREVQQGALLFVSTMRDAIRGQISPEVAYHNMMMASRHPRMTEIRLFGKLFFHSDEEDTYVAHPKRSVAYFATHPVEFVAEFKLVRWKVGFLKALLKVPLPYHAILSTLKPILDA